MNGLILVRSALVTLTSHRCRLVFGRLSLTTQNGLRLALITLGIIDLIILNRTALIMLVTHVLIILIKLTLINPHKLGLITLVTVNQAFIPPGDLALILVLPILVGFQCGW